MSAAVASLAPPSGSVARVVQFARLLRDNGFTVGRRDLVDALRYLAHDGATSERAVRGALQALFCTRASERERFNEIFDAYWRRRVGRKRTLHRQTPANAGSVAAGSERGGRHGSGLARYFEWADTADGERAADEADPADASRMGGASSREAALSADVGAITDPEEFERLLAFAERLGARLRYRIARRRRIRAKGRELDFRRTLRRSVATGGAPFTLLRKVRKEPPVSLVLFVDVSGSMDAYSLFFTRFAHAMTGRFARAQTFLFHTRLAHVTGALREANPTVMMEKMALISQGWSGGTRIGEALETFNAHYAKPFAGSRTIALIMSDGYDAGPPAVLERELVRLKGRCHKVIWLNPLMGRESYEPAARGIRAALPHIDLMAPAHNLRSLMLLEDVLARA